MTELSDELLVAYVDGQLARDQSKAIERVLDNDSVAARRVEALKDAHRRFEAAFEVMLAGQLSELEQAPEESEPAEEPEEPAPAEEPTPAPAPESESPRGFGAAVLAGSAMVLVILGAVGGYGLRGKSEPPASLSQTPPAPAATVAPTGWQQDVARAHALFGRESLEVGFESQGNLELVRFQLAKIIGPSLTVPDLSEEGLTFKRAQVLRRNGKPLAQIAYLPRTGGPVALYAMAGEDPGSPPQLGELRTATFATGGIAYLLAGRLPQGTFDKVLWAAKREIVRN